MFSRIFALKKYSLMCRGKRRILIRYSSHHIQVPWCDSVDAHDEDIDWEDVFFQQKPMVMKGLASTWRATSSWHIPGHLSQKYGKVEVPVEVGGDYMSVKTKHIRVPFDKALKKLYALEEGNSSPSSRNIGRLHYYVAQHPLEEFPGVMDELEIPSLCMLTGRGGVQRSSLWIGSAVTSSPCHFDPFHNVLVQIYGSKSVLLFAPDSSAMLKPCSSPQANTSSISFKDLQLRRIHNGIDIALKAFDPLIHIPAHQSCYAELNAGDALFIPIRWWHFCKAMSNNASVNFWWL